MLTLIFCSFYRLHTIQLCKAGESHGEFPLGSCVLPITRKQNSLRRTLHSHEKDGQAPFAQVPFPVRKYVAMWKTQQDAV